MPILGSGGSSGEGVALDTVEPSRAELVGVRGDQEPQLTMLAFIDLETRIPQDHPLRTIRRFADEALPSLSPTSHAMYALDGRRCIRPDPLLKPPLPTSLYPVPSDQA